MVKNQKTLAIFGFLWYNEIDVKKRYIFCLYYNNIKIKKRGARKALPSNQESDFCEKNSCP